MFNIKNYYVLDIINYKRKEILIKFVNKIKRGKKIKNIKILTKITEE